MTSSEFKITDQARPVPPSFDEDEDMDEDACFRLEALRWIHQALADLDRAIELGQGDTAKVLLHRIQDVLHTPAVADSTDEP
jgi:hypothetical protein